MKIRVSQIDWMTTNPGKEIKIHDLASLTNAACQASSTVSEDMVRHRILSFLIKITLVKQKDKISWRKFHDQFLQVGLHALQHEILQCQYLEERIMQAKKQCAFMDVNFFYIHLFSVNLFVLISAPWLFKCTPSMGQTLQDASSEININYIKI